MFLQTNNICNHINECDQIPCSVNETCNNSDGGFNCSCKQYYNRVNDKCLFQERATNELQFQLLFKNIMSNETFLSNLSSMVN